jgi:hypothetical protein
MRREWLWLGAAVIAFAIGASCAQTYARLAAPYYASVAARIAEMHPWRILDVAVVHDDASHGPVLRLTSEVRQHRGDLHPAALVDSSVQIGEVVETPLVFWTLLLLWPAPTLGQRGLRLLIGIPIFLGLEAITTVCQLLHPLAEASALLAGENHPVTVWERWSRFLEAGGRFALEVVAALMPVVLHQSAQRARRRGTVNDNVTALTRTTKHIAAHQHNLKKFG